MGHHCRFGGHCRVFYSVAQHSCLVADLAEARGGDEPAVRWALLHDASEAYLGDLPYPLKHHSDLGRLYRRAEDRLQRVICERFGLPIVPPRLVKEIDRALLAAERHALMTSAWEWPELAGVDPIEVVIEPWQPDRAVTEFLRRFERLAGLDA